NTRILSQASCLFLDSWSSVSQQALCTAFTMESDFFIKCGALLFRGPDPGKPLFLTPYLEAGKIDEARELSLVGPLPGVNVKSYAGYLTLNKTYNSNLFFWFFPAQRPLYEINWANQLRKHVPEIKRPTVRRNPRTSKKSVGTGFSFTDDNQGFARNQDDVGRDLYSALTQFFQIFYEYQKNDFYATGESYAGKYIPAIGYYIHQNNPSAKIKINFKGIAIGDGLCDPEMMLGGYAEFMYQTGIVDEKQKEFVKQQTDLGVMYIQQKKWVKAFEVFDLLLNGDLSQYPSFYQNVTGCTNYFNFLQCQEPKDQKLFGKFLSLPEVRKSIHVGNLIFHDGSEVEKHLLEDVMKTIKPWLAILMDNYRVLLYSGQLDVIVAAPLTERFLPTVPWSKVEEYKKADRFYWKVNSEDTEVAGYVRQVGSFYQVIVRGGGHILPYDQPERTFDMLNKFISEASFL
uniref:Probable serine carboxypeptidase CPVL n=1 Tax=Erpetoichthys calabaricus TaxID=27687 RepID=A0A8C4TK92_ERPCA